MIRERVAAGLVAGRLPGVQPLLARARPTLMRTLRLTLAAVVSFVLARLVFDTPQPLTGPLTSLLVVQATLFATLTTGLRRVLSVVAGVVIAVVLATVVGLTWWTLGATIAAALVVGQALRLGDHLLEVPISAMLVLGVGAAESAGFSRIAETLLGAGVGVLVNLVLPPTLRQVPAAASVRRVAREEAQLLERIADELAEGVSAERARGWLDDSRRVSRFVDQADQALQTAADSRRLNPRAVGTLDPLPLLRSGLDALEHCTVSMRALFRSIADGVREADEGSDDRAGAGKDDTSGGYGDELRHAFAVLLTDLAATIRAFGDVVLAEASAPDGGAEQQLAEALESLRETRARLTELLLVDVGNDAGQWQLRGSLLAAVERVLVELDVEERGRRREQWRREQLEREARQREARRRLREGAEKATRWRPAPVSRRRSGR